MTVETAHDQSLSVEIEAIRLERNGTETKTHCLRGTVFQNDRQFIQDGIIDIPPGNVFDLESDFVLIGSSVVYDLSILILDADDAGNSICPIDRRPHVDGIGFRCGDKDVGDIDRFFDIQPDVSVDAPISQIVDDIAKRRNFLILG